MPTTPINLAAELGAIHSALGILFRCAAASNPTAYAIELRTLRVLVQDMKLGKLPQYTPDQIAAIEQILQSMEKAAPTP